MGLERLGWRVEANQRVASAVAEALESLCALIVSISTRLRRRSESSTSVYMRTRLRRSDQTWRATRESGWPFARISRRLNHPNAV